MEVENIDWLDVPWLLWTDAIVILLHRTRFPDQGMIKTPTKIVNKCWSRAPLLSVN